MSIGEFDAFTSLKALRDMKKQLEAKQCQDKAKPILQYIQKQQPLSMYDLRIQFQHWLAKSTELDTRQIAYTNIFQLVQQNQSQNALQLMLSCLQIPIYMKSSDTIIKTINIIVGIYGDQINVQEIYKFIEIVLKHFSDQSSVIQQSCAECWITIYTKNVSKRNLQQRVLLMFSTLSNLIGQGANRQTQETSAIVLSLLFETLHNNRDITFMKEVLKEFYQIYIKSSVDNAGIYTGMFYLLKSVTIQNFTNCQIAIIDKALQTINNLKFNYRTRIGACNLMKLIATQYQNSNFKVILGNLHEQVIVILDESTKDRVIAVQNSARQALKEWMKLKLQVDAIADIEQNIDLENSNGFLKKNTGTGGGQVFVNQITAQRQPDLKQQIMQNDLDQTVDFNNIQNEDNLNIWQKALKLDQNGLTEDAIQLLLQDGDDLYLLRFLMQYNDPKTLFDKLNISLALRLVDTLIIILESDFLNLLCLDFVQGYMDIGLKDWFVDDDFIEYLAYFADQNTLAAQSCRQIGEQLK